MRNCPSSSPQKCLPHVTRSYQTLDNLLFTEVMSTPLTLAKTKTREISSCQPSHTKHSFYVLKKLFFCLVLLFSLLDVMLLNIRQNNLFPDKQKNRKDDTPAKKE